MVLRRQYCLSLRNSHHCLAAVDVGRHICRYRWIPSQYSWHMEVLFRRTDQLLVISLIVFSDLDLHPQVWLKGTKALQGRLL